MSSSFPFHPTRTMSRAHLPEIVRVERLEEDADNLDTRQDTIEVKLDKINARLLGVLCSAIVAIAMLAINLVVK